jgi:hypothetical protein
VPRIPLAEWLDSAFSRSDQKIDDVHVDQLQEPWSEAPNLSGLCQVIVVLPLGETKFGTRPY